MNSATYTRTRISQYMTEFLRHMEHKLGDRLTQQDLRSPLYRTAARVYAEAMLKAERVSTASDGGTETKGA